MGRFVATWFVTTMFLGVLPLCYHQPSTELGPSLPRIGRYQWRVHDGRRNQAVRRLFVECGNVGYMTHSCQPR